METLVGNACGRAVGYLLVGCALSACATTTTAHGPATSSVDVGAERSTNNTPSPSIADQSSEPIVNPLIDERAPDESRALPELRFKHLGMHIGGGSNTPQSKKPFLNAISEREETLLLCYRLINDAGKSGSFGLDLYVAKSGGAPEIRAIRQKLGDQEFVRCMSDAFLTVQFAPTERPTMVSYSLFFEMVDGPS